MHPLGKTSKHLKVHPKNENTLSLPASSPDLLFLVPSYLNSGLSGEGGLCGRAKEAWTVSLNKGIKFKLPFELEKFDFVCF